MRGIKVRSADMTPEDSRLLTATPKAVLYAMVKHLAAASDGDSYEGSLESGVRSDNTGRVCPHGSPSR